LKLTVGLVTFCWSLPIQQEKKRAGGRALSETDTNTHIRINYAFILYSVAETSLLALQRAQLTSRRRQHVSLRRIDIATLLQLPFACFSFYLLFVACAYCIFIRTYVCTYLYMCICGIVHWFS